MGLTPSEGNPRNGETKLNSVEPQTYRERKETTERKGNENV
jgi:hypothetical protein